jgi:hypothetical protein
MSTDKKDDNQPTYKKQPTYKQEMKKLAAINLPKFFLGWVIFILVFIITIPYVLFKTKFYSILEAYLPNLDLIATVLTWRNGPYDIWNHFYPSPIYNYYGYFSQTIINYMALLGLTFIITRETKKTGSMIKGWSMAFVMILMTYLLPAQFISMFMDSSADYLKIQNPALNDIVIALLGFIMTIGVISMEAYILKNYGHILEYGVKHIMKFPKLLKK